MNSIDFEIINNLFIQLNKSSNPQIKQSLLKQLEELDGRRGFLPSLVRIIDLNDQGGNICCGDRQFAAILLKNSVTRIIQQEDLRQRYDQEIQIVKQFLLRSFGEPEHQVFIQLHTITSKLARFYWPNQWPELIPALLTVISNDKQFMPSFEATCCLHEIMLELAGKACRCGSFYPLYYELCVQLFHPIAKCWALRMKSIQSYLCSFTTEISSYSPSDFNQAGRVPSFRRDEDQEISIFYAIVMAKVMIMIIETAYIDIVKRSSCFSCLWKTYMGSIQISATFLRKVRPLIEEVISFLQKNQSQRQPNPLPLNERTDAYSSFQGNVSVSVLERFYALDIDDFNCSSDFYFPVMQHSKYLCEGFRGFVIVINLIMKLIKVLNCLPIHVQRKYPIEVVPLLEQLILFYYKFQTDEISADLLQNRSLTVLPLTSLTFASAIILSNIITCNAYKDFNLYRTTGNHHSPYSIDGANKCQNATPSTSTAGSMMDESVIEANVSVANNFIREFFNPLRVKQLFERQLVFCFHYNTQALEIWKNSPEKFFVDEESGEGMGVEYLHVRTTSERLFLALLELQPETVTEILLSLLQDVERQNRVTGVDTSAPGVIDAASLNAEILLWDAVYTATGLGVEVIASRLGLSPTDWLLKIIGPLFSNLLQSNKCGSLQPGGQQILRARMLKLISAWISQFDVSVHSTILPFLVNLLSSQSNSDVVVQLSTVKALSSLINLKTFQHKALVPSALPCIQALVQLIKASLEESETKQLVLALIKDIIQLVGVQIFDPNHPDSTEYALQLSSSLLSLWDSLDHDDIVRSSVLEVFIVFIQSTKETATNANFNDNGHSISLVERLLSVVRDCHSNRYCRLSTYTNAASSRASEASDTGLVMDSLQLLVSIVRNIEARTFSEKFPKAFETFCSLLELITVSTLQVSSGEDNLVVQFESESNVRIIIERVCYFVEGFFLSFADFLGREPLLEAMRLRQVLSDFYRQVVKVLPPKFTKPVLRSMEILLITAPKLMAETLYQANALVLPINMCCSEAACGNLSGLTKSYFVSEEHTLFASNVIIQLILGAPDVLLKTLQGVKHEILSFLFRMTGVTNTNLCEGIILKELINVMLKASHMIQNASSSRIAYLYRLRWYCFALWSFIQPTTTSLSPCSTNSSTDDILPTILPLDSMRFWLKDFCSLLARYSLLCEEVFSPLLSLNNAVGDKPTNLWQELYYNNQLAEMVRGESPSIHMDATNLTSICGDLTSSNIERKGNGENNTLHCLLFNIQFYESHFTQFHQQMLAALPAKRIQRLDYANGVIEREDQIVQEFLLKLFNHRIHQTFLCSFCHQRFMTLQSAFGEDSCLQAISSSVALAGEAFK